MRCASQLSTLLRSSASASYTQTRSVATPLLNRRAAFSGRTAKRSSPARQHALKCYQVLDISSSGGDPSKIPLNLQPNLQPPTEAVALPVPQPPSRPAYVPPALFAVFQWYAKCLETNPVLTKSLTALLGFCLGDSLAQSIEGTHTHLDVYRCLRLGSYGLVLDGPVQHFWYRFLDRVVWPEDSTSMKAILTKTAADQLLWSPVSVAVVLLNT
jgi:hypothetical protein